MIGDLQWAMRRRLMDVLDKKNCGTPRTHENGFIQIDLDFPWRLHVWPEPGRVKKQATDSPIHDHQWGFQSWTLYGCLRDVIYVPRFVSLQKVDGWIPSPLLHEYYEVRDGRLRSTGQFALAHRWSWHTIPVGGTYRMEAGAFHASEWDDMAVTVICRDAPTTATPRVLCPFGQVPDNAFDRATANPPHVLWDHIWRGVHAALREERF